MAKGTLKGRLEGIRYQGDNYWTVASFRTDRGKVVTIVGNLLTVTPGDSLQLCGEWTSHPKFGPQFQIQSFEVLAPSTNEGVIGFLESKLSDIGRNRAIELVRHFGADKVFEVVANEPHRLTEVPGITPDRADRIHKDYQEVRGLREAFVFLKQFHLTDNQAARVMKRYGASVRQVLREDPYQLIDDIDGFGFKTVDALARRVGVDHHGIPRAKAGCTHVLRTARDNGNIFLPLTEMRRQVVKELAIETKLVDEALRLLAEKGSVFLEGSRVYSAKLHRLEMSVASKLGSLLAGRAGTENSSGPDSPEPSSEAPR